MGEDIKLQPPAQAHMTAPLPYDYEAQEAYPAQKNKIRSLEDMRREWRHGSKARAAQYYLLYFLACFIFGAIIGIIIGLAIRYT